MKSFRNFTLAAIGLAIFVLATALSNTAPAGAQNVKVDPVKVVNTAGDWAAPVPVQAQGTTNIAGNVGITGTPNVNVANPIQVGNTTANPVLVRDVDNPALQPFQASGGGTFENGMVDGIATLPTTVPAGKRLVIEYVSIIASLPANQKLVKASINYIIDNGPAPSSITHRLLVNAQGRPYGGLSDIFTVSQQVRFYVPPYANILVILERDNYAGTGIIDFTVSGHLVNLP